jgi:hypothetical protein
VHETGGVDRLEPGEELGRDVLRLLELEGPTLLQHFEQGLAVDVLH